MKRILLACVLSLIVATTAYGNPFFAFDNIAVKGPGELGMKLDELKRAGYEGLSWSGTDVGQIQSVIAASEARGLRVYALYVGFPLERGRLVVPENLSEILGALKGHGTILWVYVQSKAFKASEAAGDVAAVEGLRETADRAAKHGVKVALYPHTGFWVETMGDALRVARKVDRENLGVTFNLCHALKTGDEGRIGALLREAGEKLLVVSINGADAGVGRAGGWDRLIRPLGEGTFDVGVVMGVLKEIGFEGPVGFQGYAIAGERGEILGKTMGAWRALNGGKGSVEGRRTRED